MDSSAEGYKLHRFLSSTGEIVDKYRSLIRQISGRRKQKKTRAARAKFHVTYHVIAPSGMVQ